MSKLRIVLGAAAALMAGVAAAYFAGVRMELDGTGSKPMLKYGTRATHDDEVERSRAEQQSLPEAPREVAPPVAVAAKPGAAPAAEAPAADSYWSDFRGPGRLGVYAQTPILTTWPEAGLRSLWRQPVGGGYASIVVAGGLAYTIEQRRANEVVAAYDLATGRERWTNSWAGDFRESMGGDGPRATPVWHDGRIYAMGAEGELRVIDARGGTTVWRKNILSDNGAENLQWGMAASPLVVDGMVIVQPGGSRGRSVVAYNKDTGARVWASLDDKQAYTSPVVAELAGKRQIVTVTAERVVGLDPATGGLLWEYPWRTDYDVNSSQPVPVGPDQFFISAGYGHGAALVEVSGAGGTMHARQVWMNNRMKNKFNSSVLHEGYLYGLDEGILACMEVKTGTQKWKGGRYGFGQVLLASGHLVVITEGGELVLVKATPEGHQELARFEALDGKTWNNPAISNGVLLVRNTTEMAAYRIAP